jgi:hypothetical protein
MLELLAFLFGTLTLAFPLVAGGLVIWFSIRKRNNWHLLLSRIASELSLEFQPGGFLQRARASGSVASFPTVIDTYSQGSGKNSTLYSRITVAPPLSDELGIHKENFLSGIAQRFMGEDIQAGVTEFDDTFVLKGVSDDVGLSIFGSRSRAAIWSTLTDARFRVEGGKLIYRQRGYLESPSQALDAVQKMTELGEALSEFSQSPAQGLLHHAFHDPEPSFRARCFDALLRSHWGTSECKEAMERGRSQDDPNFLFLIEQRGGKPDLQVVTRLVREGRLDEPLHRSAVAMLGDRFAGGLTVEEPLDEGGLSLSQGNAGGLSEEQPQQPRRASRRKVGE